MGWSGWFCGVTRKRILSEFSLPARSFRGDGNVVSGVEAQVETQCRLRGRYRTSQIFPRFARFEHRQISIKDVDVAVGARQHQDLTASQRGTRQEASYQPPSVRSTGISKPKGSLHSPSPVYNCLILYIQIGICEPEN